MTTTDATTAATTAAPGTTEHRRYTGPDGARDYDLYVPHSGDRKPTALVVMLHGAGQHPTDFAAATDMNTQADHHAFLVAYPAQSLTANFMGSWNWFRDQDQRAGTGEPAIIAGLTREIAEEHDIDPDRIYIAGFSAGGAMAAIMAATHPELYSAAAVHSGLAHQAATDLMSGFLAMQGAGNTPQHTGIVPLMVFHGDKDPIVSDRNAEHLLTARVGPSPAPTTTVTSPAGGRRGHTRRVFSELDGTTSAECWIVHGGGHAWSGGNPDQSFTDPDGPSATTEITRFFQLHQRVRP